MSRSEKVPFHEKLRQIADGLEEGQGLVEDIRESAEDIRDALHRAKAQVGISALGRLAKLRKQQKRNTD